MSKTKLLWTSKFLNYPPLPYIFRHNVRYYETSILKSDIVPAESLKIWGCTNEYNSLSKAHVLLLYLAKSVDANTPPHFGFEWLKFAKR